MVAQKRVAIYDGVSTVDKGQDPETQLLVLREYAARRAFVIVGEYVDYASGTREDRPQYQALFLRSAQTATRYRLGLALRPVCTFNPSLGQLPERVPPPGRGFYLLSGSK